MRNIFEDPKIYKKEIIEKVRIPIEKRKKIDGKSLTCVFFTKFCEVGCSFCFFNSKKKRLGLPQEKFEFSDYGFERFIDFLNKSNNGYLLVSGAGEPFEKKEYIMQTVSKAISDRIVIVTSGFWAKNYSQAEEIILELYKRLTSRASSTHLVLRLSVDKCHYHQLGFDIVNNIFSVFRKYFKGNKNFELQVHTMINDNTMDKIIENFGDCKKTNHEIRPSDNEKIIKIVPERYKLSFDDGYEIIVGMAKTFYPNLMANVNNPELLSKSLSVFDEDMIYSEHGNPAIVKNTDGKLGFDFWLNYNGNVTAWGNQTLDDINNIYVDDYEKVIQDTYDNIISYSFIDKGYQYRKNIVKEVSPEAVYRTESSNERDFAGMMMLEETKTALYYAIRVIKDYLKSGELQKKDIESLSSELQETISKSKEELIRLYECSDYSILDQYADKMAFNLSDWLDLYTLIRLGHYKVSERQIARDLSYIKLFHKGEVVEGIESLINNINKQEQYQRIMERINLMNPKALDLCIKRNKLGILKRITPIIRIVIEKDGYILLASPTKENIRFSQDMIFLPGGAIEHTESARDAAVRKVHDEIDYDGRIFVTDFLGILENIWDNNGKPYHEMDIVFRATIDSVDINNPPKGKEGDVKFNWYKVDDMNSLNILPKSFCELIPSWLEIENSVKINKIYKTEIFGKLQI